ncbi:hypothetical protein ACFL08_05060 [Patescibacteria group bacterium]
MSTKGTKILIESLIENREYSAAWDRITIADNLEKDYVDTQLIEIITYTIEDCSPGWVFAMVKAFTDKREYSEFILASLKKLLDTFIKMRHIEEANEVAEFIDEHEKELYEGDSDSTEEE